MTARTTHWIDGGPWAGRPARSGDVHNPATGEVTSRVDFASTAEAGAAVAAARAAFPGWRDTSIARRTQVLFAFRELVSRHADDLARVVTREHGKTTDDAAGEVQRGLEVVEFACGIGQLLQGGYSENVSTRVDAYSIRQPLGVAAGVTPFNFPVMVPMWMFPVAIACGNTFVLKPSEKDPAAAVMLARLWQQAGLPDGVFNVVHGDREAVDALLHHPDVAAVSFVGSTPIARHVYETVAARGARVQALGGAKNHMVVLPDADLDVAADAAVSAGYGSAGQRCMAISAVVPVGDIADALVERVAQRTRKLTVGPGDAPGTQMGPLVTAAHRDRVASYVDGAVAEGAALPVDGREHAIDGPAGGFFLGPSLVDHVTPRMPVYTDEVFGPVLSVVREPTFEAAVRLVNDNPYGNGTAVFTGDGLAARRFTSEVEVGMVGVNLPIPVPMAYYSFGGWNQSLFGDTHVYGSEGVHFYTRTKAVTARWPESASTRRAINLGFPTGE